MRTTLAPWIALALFSIPTVADAQPPKRLPPEIRKAHVGFQQIRKDEESAYKIGLWVPLHIEVFGGTDGVDVDSSGNPPYLLIETDDNEDVKTQLRVPVKLKENETRSYVTYVKIGHRTHSDEVKITLRANGRDYRLQDPPSPSPLPIDAHLYLVLGSRLPDLFAAAEKINRGGKQKEDWDVTKLRNVVYEDNVRRLPDRWFGYNSVDLILLTTDNDRFLNELRNDATKLKALAQWVRRGGRLIVPIGWQKQSIITALLKCEVGWHPPIPVVPPDTTGKAEENGIIRLSAFENWADIKENPFERLDPKNPGRKVPIPVASLDNGRVAPGEWDVLVRDDTENSDRRPLITRVRYGLGQITYMAVSIEDPAFSVWGGRDQFLQSMMRKLAPRAPANINEFDGGGFGQHHKGRHDDLASNLTNVLDNFDVTVIPFHWVALFIILYIIVVGPLDFFLLKYVFKRLEWTWITFPTVVVGISVIAYFAAYALKGRDMKINKVDIVDIDLRTSENPLHNKIYGQTFFTILSPRIQNYTIGIEPNPEFWGEQAAPIPRTADLMQWYGRPTGGPDAMGRSSSSGFFKRPYEFHEGQAGLIGLSGVPIPVWTTKAFTASWEQPLTAPPVTAELTYHIEKDLRLTGKIGNNMGVDLSDVWLIYNDQFFPLDSGLKSIRGGGEATPIAIKFNEGMDVRNWFNGNADKDPAPENRKSHTPTAVVKQILFHEKIDAAHNFRNHLLRPLDFSWRVGEDHAAKKSDRGLREAILFARVQYLSGNAESLTSSVRNPLPTKLWLGDYPKGDPRQSRLSLTGDLSQDTYLRILLRVKPAE